MIPILYQREETEFLSQGYGRLADIISCTVTEERNGIYECEFQYPITGVNYAEIQEGRIIACTHDNTGDIQPFVIYRKSAPINGIVTFNAHHISYELNNVIVAPFTAENISMTLASLNLYSMTTNRFNFLTDKTVYQKEYVLDHPASARELLGGVEGSILDFYGTGEWEFNRFLCYLHLHRGTNSGVTIRYAKNLIDITHELDSSDVYDAIVPYWKDSETGEVVYGGVVVGSTTIKYTAPITTENRVIIRTDHGEPLEIEYERITAVAFDFSDQFEDKPTADQLEQFAEEYLNNNEPWIPHENIRIDFVQLAETAEYSEYAPLQSVKLCDSVNVYYSALGVNAENIKVISTTWNVLAEKYDEIELGKPRTSFAQLILGEAYSEVEGLKTEYITATKLQQAIQNATDQITGATGGNIVFHYNAEGHPYEMLIMDTDSEATASHIWRYNYAGWGHSSDGGQTYSLAATLDGGFVADFITTGVLNADLILAGTIQGNGDNNYWDLVNGILSVQTGMIGGFTLTNGELVAGDPSDLSQRTLQIVNTGLTFDYPFIPAGGTEYESWRMALRPSSSTIKWSRRYKRSDDVIVDTDPWSVGLAPVYASPLRGYSFYIQRDITRGSYDPVVYWDTHRFFSAYSNPDDMTENTCTLGNDSYYTSIYARELLDFTSNDFHSYSSNDVLIEGMNGIVLTTETDQPTASNGIRLWTDDVMAFRSGAGMTFSNVSGNITFNSAVKVNANFQVTGTKNRLAETKDFGERLFYSYETPSPYFGDIGEGTIAEDGKCIVWLDDVFAQAVCTASYQVFLQAYGNGKCYVSERNESYFVVCGDPGLKFGFEVKAKQKGFETHRLDREFDSVTEIHRYAEEGYIAFTHHNDGKIEE